MTAASGTGAFLAVRLPPTFPYLVLASGFYLHHLAYIRAAGTSPAENRQVRNGGDRTCSDAPPATGILRRPAWCTLTDRDRRRATATVAGQFSVCLGRRLAGQPRNGQIRTRCRLICRLSAENPGAALSTLLDLAAAEIGEPLTVAALRRAFDAALGSSGDRRAVPVPADARAGLLGFSRRAGMSSFLQACRSSPR